MALKEVNISKEFANYSQRNNEILPHVACGPTNMCQALEYAGWEIDLSIYPKLNQPEDKLMKFTRSNPAVLKYYEAKYPALYNNWIKEAKSLRKGRQELWEVNCVKSYAPNEVHDVMNFATNLFLGFNERDIKCSHYATHLENRFDIDAVKGEIDKGLPVVTSVRFGKCGHYITIVGYQYNEKNAVVNFIIDNTYGRFNFETETYEKVSGNDNIIPVKELVERARPVMHLFEKGPVGRKTL